LVTCAELPGLERDDQLLLEPLAALGVKAVPAVWDDPEVDWGSFDLVVLRSPWDCMTRRDRFVAWAHSLPALYNPAAVGGGNPDRRYLGELGGGGVPGVPTTFLSPHDFWQPPATRDDYVIKPAVSAGSRDTGRYGPADEVEAVAHVRRLQQARRLTMIQPYL